MINDTVEKEVKMGGNVNDNATDEEENAPENEAERKAEGMEHVAENETGRF